MATTPFNQPDMTSQGGTQYKTNIDDGMRVLAQIAAGLNVQAQSTPNMTVHIIGCRIWRRDSGAAVVVAAQDTDPIVAPAYDPRIDLVSIDLDPASGNYGDIVVTTGVEDASPSAPAVPAGHVPLATIELDAAQATIINEDITDLRHMKVMEGALFLAVDDTDFQILTATNVQQLLEEIDGHLLSGSPASGFHVTAADDLDIDVAAGLLYDAATAGLTVKTTQTDTLSAPSSDDRIDRIVLNIDPDHANYGLIEVIEGAEASSPTAPALTDKRYPLAQVYVTYSQTQLVQANITDERPTITLPSANNSGGLPEVYLEELDYIALGVIPVDNSIPQNNEGTEVFYAPFSLSDADNRLVIEWSLQMGGGATIGTQIVALFQNSDTDAFHAKAQTTPADATNRFAAHSGRIVIAPGTTDEIIYKLRAGGVSSLSYLNGTVGGAILGAAKGSSFLLREIGPEIIPDYSGLDTVTQDYITALDVKPSITRAGFMDDFFTGLISAGLWPKLDILNLSASHNRSPSKVNAIDPGTYDMSLVNNPVFNSDAGWTSLGAGNYLTLGVAPDALTNFQLNDAHIGIYVLGEFAQQTVICGTVTASTLYIQPRRASATANNLGFRINDATDTQMTADGSSAGHFVANRVLSTEKEMYKDGALVGTATVDATSVSTVDLSVLAGSSTTNIGNTCAIYHIGAGLSATEVADFTALCEAYLTAIGTI